MAKKEKKQDRSWIRLIFWEILFLIGLGQVLTHPMVDQPLAKTFYYGAVFCTAAYPLLYMLRWKMSEGLLGLIFWPVRLLFGLGLGVASYLWLVYVLMVTGSPYSSALTQHWVVLGVLFVLVYFPLLEPILGVGKRYFSLGELFWLLLYSGIGGFLCYLLGRFVDTKFGVSIGPEWRFPLWLFLILIGIAIGAFAQGRGKN